MIRHRIAAALVVISALYGSLYYDARNGVDICFNVLMACLTVKALHEFYRMARHQGWEPFRRFGYVMGVVLVFAHMRWCWEKWHDFPRAVPDVMSTVIALIVLGCFLLQGLKRDPKGAMNNIGSTLLGLIYVWFLPSFLPKMRHLGLRHGWEYDGIEFVFICILVAKCSDIGGFLVGKKLGRHKLCPSLSPKKTWEGTIGGVLLSIIVVSSIAIITPMSAVAKLHWWQIGLLGFLMAVSSLLGDLMESLLKRDSQVKDAGSSVPGFGGVLDMVDSLMVSAPVMYYFLILSGAKAGWSQ